MLEFSWIDAQRRYDEQSKVTYSPTIAMLRLVVRVRVREGVCERVSVRMSSER